MKSELKAKLLRHLAAKKGNAGFTLIELLVVIIIIGILSAIALPSFLNQANKARQSEAKTYIGSMNRGQQAFYLENTEFAQDLNELGIGVKPETTYYKYDVVADGTGTNGGNEGNAISTAESLEVSLKPYGGAVQVIQPTDAAGTKQDATTVAILCEAETPQKGVLAAGNFDGLVDNDVQTDPAAFKCGGGTKSIQ